MSSSPETILQQEKRWHMPITPESYDRSPLTVEERQALELCSKASRRACGQESSNSREALAARKTLARFNPPLADLFHLRHGGRSSPIILDVQRFMRHEMHRHSKMFWDWSSDEWIDTLCPTWTIFEARTGYSTSVRPTIMDAAYLFGDVTDLRSVGIGQHIKDAADTYFGEEHIREQVKTVLGVLTGKGYCDGPQSVAYLQQCLSMLFVLNRSPYLEDISGELLALVAEDGTHMRQASHRIALSLQELKHLPRERKDAFTSAKKFDGSGMAQEWYAWCMAWYEQAVDLSPRQRDSYMGHILAVGRWLHVRVPEIHEPSQWTEDLALRFRSDLCSWTIGQYVSSWGRQVIEGKGKMGEPLKPQAIASYLTTVRRYFADLTKRPHTVGGEPARRITLDFSPQDALATPTHIRRAIDAIAPRDINLLTWAKLVIAAATLSQSDLPSNTRYPLSFYRALGLIWVTSARRLNEIARLPLDCVRQDWDPNMSDEDGQPVEQLIGETQSGTQEKAAQICYLHIPAGKNRGPFWVWVPDYVAEAIDAWKRDRPPRQRKRLDRKTREEVDYLFCYRDAKVGPRFINRSLIPALCRKAGVEVSDAKGRITGHRGRSTRLTLLRSRGVSLDDLAEYAGHANTQTIRRYARQNPIQLHRTIQAADDVSRIVEGVVDMQAAAQALPALRWFIGYDADGEPMFCGNQLYITCPHRLDCERCGMFIGGEKARLLQAGEQTLPVTSKVPMTPLEKCVVEGDQKGAEVCRAALQQLPAPETPDISLIFNPEGLSNRELEKLAEIATAPALDKLQQALDAHEKRLVETQQHKTSRSALVGGQRKRIVFIQGLIAHCEQRIKERGNSVI